MFQLPELDYPYNALEPYVDEETMKIHHSKHHQTYLDKLNAALQNNPELYEKSVEDILSNLDAIPENIRTAVKNHGGGYLHHNLFWKMMNPDGGGEPTGEVAEAINNTFGNFEAFKDQFSASALLVFGSGWTWLVKDKEGSLSILNTSNQDSPVSSGLTPLLGLDVWEHAYYLKYQNRRPEYVEKWWSVVNWNYVEANF